jgi:hypothetical protein
MFVCNFSGVFGMGHTLMLSFEDMIENMDLGEFDDTPSPQDCDFFEQIEVNIRETKTWSIEPEYDE